jgi:hypothetical protein
MADIGEKLGPVVEALLEPGETLEGMCFGSRSGFMSSKLAIIAVTDRRLIVQETDRKQRPKGEPTSVPADQVAGFSTGGFGAGDVQSSIMNATSTKITVKTASGEKVKLMMAKGGGPLGRLMGGETQERGVQALHAWLQRNSRG